MPSILQRTFLRDLALQRTRSLYRFPMGVVYRFVVQDAKQKHAFGCLFGGSCIGPERSLCFDICSHVGKSRVMMPFLTRSETRHA